MSWCSWLRQALDELEFPSFLICMMIIRIYQGSITWKFKNYFLKKGKRISWKVLVPLFFLAWVGNFVTSKSWCIRWHKGQYCFILPVANVSPSLEWNNSSYGRCQLLFNPHRMTNCFWFIFGSVPLIWRLTSCFWANKSPSQNTRSLMFLNILLYNCFRLHFSKLPWAEPRTS